MKIKILPDHVINQIKAGEVVENPASVVKELIDNAIDASAFEIVVEIQAGGRQLIRVSDNGCGMTKEDACLSFERHATSKLGDFQDLEKLTTMGFRGEALASIASISEIDLLTCPSLDESSATLVHTNAGKILQCMPSIRSQGTTIDVKSLFFNVPVRRKFQKSPAYDVADIVKVITQLSLANPNIRFQLISEKKTLLNVGVKENTFLEQLKMRISQVLGTEYKASLLTVDFQNDWIQLKGFIGHPGYARNNRSGGHLIINKRPVVSSLISKAIADGYGTSLKEHSYPVFVLHLTLPTQDVDVNVHPQKKEVRLKTERELRSLISDVISNALSYEGGKTYVSELKAFEMKEGMDFEEFPPSFRFEYTPLSLERKGPPEKSLENHLPLTFRNSFKILTTLPGFAIIETFGALEKLGEAGIYFVDMKRGYNRWFFNLLVKNGERESEQLLLPETFELTIEECEVMQNLLPLFSKMGIQVQEFGKGTFAIFAKPTHLTNQEALVFIRNVLEEKDSTNLIKDKMIFSEKFTSSLAEKYSRLYTKRVTLEEAHHLIQELLESGPLFCTKGMPIFAPFKQDGFYVPFGKIEKN